MGSALAPIGVSNGTDVLSAGLASGDELEGLEGEGLEGDGPPGSKSTPPQGSTTASPELLRFLRAPVLDPPTPTQNTPVAKAPTSAISRFTSAPALNYQALGTSTATSPPADPSAPTFTWKGLACSPVGRTVAVGGAGLAGGIGGSFVAPVAGTIAGGALASGAAEAGMEEYCDGKIDPVKVGITTVAGGFGGEMGGAVASRVGTGVLGRVVTGAVASGSGNLMSQDLEGLTGRRTDFSFTELGANTVAGAGLGYVLPPIRVGRGAGTSAEPAGTANPEPVSRSSPSSVPEAAATGAASTSIPARFLAPPLEVGATQSPTAPEAVTAAPARPRSTSSRKVSLTQVPVAKPAATPVGKGGAADYDPSQEYQPPDGASASVRARPQTMDLVNKPAPTTAKYLGKNGYPTLTGADKAAAQANLTPGYYPSQEGNFAMKGTDIGHALTEHIPSEQTHLTAKAALDKTPQGMWTDPAGAEQVMKDNWQKMLNAPNQTFSATMPRGLGQVIMPDGSVVKTDRFTMVGDGYGGLKTAYPSVTPGKAYPLVNP